MKHSDAFTLISPTNRFPLRLIGFLFATLLLTVSALFTNGDRVRADYIIGSVPVSEPNQVIVNPITNKIYVIGLDNFTVIDGRDHTTIIVPAAGLNAFSRVAL